MRGYRHPPSRVAAGAAALSVALCLSLTVPVSAQAASCPSVADPQGIETDSPYQLDLPDYEAQIGKMLALSENPLFAGPGLGRNPSAGRRSGAGRGAGLSAL